MDDRKITFSDVTVQEAWEELLAAAKGVSCLLREIGGDDPNGGALAYQYEANWVLADALNNAIDNVVSAEKRARAKAITDHSEI